MTPNQYYFPYIFDIALFNTELEPFNLSAHISLDNDTKIPDELLIIRKKDNATVLTIQFGRTVMLENGNIYHWETDTDYIEVVQININDLEAEPWTLNETFNLIPLHLGKNKSVNHLDTDLLVTYARKSSIPARENSDEKFAIVLIDKKSVNILPFEEFNQTNHDYDYVWPATAKLDIENGKLYGKGIRMPDFCIEIEKACL